MILAIKSDDQNPEIFLINNGQPVAEKKWASNKDLYSSLIGEIKELLVSQNSGFNYLKGLIVFKGPGSFTGLRIGATVANALADSLDVPIVGADGDDWLKSGLNMLGDGLNQKIVIPKYGNPANTTKPKK